MAGKALTKYLGQAIGKQGGLGDALKAGGWKAVYDGNLAYVEPCFSYHCFILQPLLLTLP